MVQHLWGHCYALVQVLCSQLAEWNTLHTLIGIQSVVEPACAQAGQSCAEQLVIANSGRHSCASRTEDWQRAGLADIHAMEGKHNAVQV